MTSRQQTGAAMTCSLMEEVCDRKATIEISMTVAGSRVPGIPCEAVVPFRIHRDFSHCARLVHRQVCSSTFDTGTQAFYDVERRWRAR
jgi:hypothetical protein